MMFLQESNFNDFQNSIDIENILNNFLNINSDAQFCDISFDIYAHCNSGWELKNFHYDAKFDLENNQALNMNLNSNGVSIHKDFDSTESSIQTLINEFNNFKEKYLNLESKDINLDSVSFQANYLFTKNDQHFKNFDFHILLDKNNQSNELTIQNIYFNYNHSLN